MGKEMQSTSNCALKGNKLESSLEDGISKLPDDILFSMVSLLPMKDAARTSALSRRWRYLWTYATGSLEFDHLQLIEEMSRTSSLISEVQCCSFVNWVNRVLISHQGSTIDEFKVGFSVDSKQYKRDIERWIEFAIRKRVKRLELCIPNYKVYYFQAYILRTQFLRKYKVDSLTTLRLDGVEVTGKVVEYVLSNCPLLEVLYVAVSHFLVNLKVSSPLLKLKHLEIVACCNMKCIKLNAINLVSFKYSGPRIKISVKSLAFLVEASIGDDYASYFLDNISHFSSYLPCLETLTLDLIYHFSASFPEFPELRNLKKLELIINPHEHNLLFCTHLLEMSPLLQRFVLRFAVRKVPDCGKLVEKAKRPHKCLKVVDFIGFVGDSFDYELAIYICNNTVSLEKIIIHPRHAFWSVNWPPDKITEARRRARQLETRLPPGAELVIL